MANTNVTLVSSTGSGVTVVDDLIASGLEVSISENLSVTGSSYFKDAQVQVDGYLKSEAGISGSLTKLSDGTSYLVAGSNVSISTGSNGAVTISSTGGGSGGSSAALAYNGYTTSNLQWSSTTWEDFHTVPSNFTDTLQNGITRNNSTFTVASGGIYYFRSDFNHQNYSSYTSFRLSGSNGTIIQQTVRGGVNSPVDGDGADLIGTFYLSANESFKLQYIWKNDGGGSLAWSAGAFDHAGEAFRTGAICIFRVGPS